MKRLFLYVAWFLVCCLWTLPVTAAPATAAPATAAPATAASATANSTAGTAPAGATTPAVTSPSAPAPAQVATPHTPPDDDKATPAEPAPPTEAELQEAAKLRAQQEAAATTEKLRKEAEAAQAATQASFQQDKVWEEALREQRAELNALEVETDNLSKHLGGVIRPLRLGLPELEETARRVFSLSITHKADPLMLETLNRRAMLLAAGLRQQLQPVLAAKTLITDLTDRLNQVKNTMPDVGLAPSDEGPSQDMRGTDRDGEELLLSPTESAAWNQLHKVEYLLNRVTHRLDQALAPAETLLGQLETMDTKLIEYLPPIWQKYYLTVPTRFFDPAGWQNLGDRFSRMHQNMLLRLSVEVPQSLTAWQGFGLRLLNMMLLGGVALFFVNRWMRRLPQDKLGHEPVLARRTILYSLGWLCAGLAVMAASFGSRGEIFRLLLLCGSLIIMWGEMALAWDMRCLTLDRRTGLSPMWSLYAISAFGILLSYPNLPSALYALSWLIAGLTSLWLTRPGHTSPLPSMEAKLLMIHRLALWGSVGLAVFGWARMGILLLVTVDCLLINSQMVIGMMQLINRTAEVREDEQMERSLISGLLAACLAPLVFILVPVGMALWVVALPGGAPLLWHYLGSAVSIGSATFNALHILLIVSAFYITRAAITACQKLLMRLSATTTRLDSSLIPPMQTGITYGLWILFGLFALRALGFGLDNLAVIAGGLSVGIGFGLQTIVNNFLSGLILIFSRTLHEGDIIDVGTLQGTVRKISVRATTVETFDNAVIFVPNSEFVANRLINWTRNGRSVRRDLALGVAYGSDPALVEQLLLEVAQNCPLVLRRPQPFVLFQDFADSSLNFVLRYWSDISTAGTAASDMRKQIATVFTEHGIEIAYPQMDIHLSRAPAAPRLPRPGQDAAAPSA